MTLDTVASCVTLSSFIAEALVVLLSESIAGKGEETKVELGAKALPVPLDVVIDVALKVVWFAAEELTPTEDVSLL